jgi:hypothetical protein
MLTGAAGQIGHSGSRMPVSWRCPSYQFGAASFMNISAKGHYFAESRLSCGLDLTFAMTLSPRYCGECQIRHTRPGRSDCAQSHYPLMLPLSTEHRRPEKILLQILDLVPAESRTIAEEGRVGCAEFRVTRRQMIELRNGIA